MLRRKDLIDEFELIVQQEIKNYNDSTLAMHKAINDLDSRLNSICTEYNRRLAEIHSDFISDRSQKQKDYSGTEKAYNSLQSKVNDIKKELHEKIKQISEDHYDFCDQFATKEVVKEFIEKVYEPQIDSINKMLSDIRSDLNAVKPPLTEYTNKLVATISSQIEEQIEENEKSKNEIQSQIDILRVDKKCLKEEVNHLKETIFIQSKQIEDLYNEINKIMPKEFS
jgi:chromosome segregation ATPase